MVLVVGARASGKKSFVRTLGFAAADCSENLADPAPVLLGLEREVGRCVESGSYDPDAPLSAALLGKRVVVCTEVGSGIVPADARERLWRDAVGKTCNRLAEKADVVVRMVCGIPLVLKGGLSVPQREPRVLELVIMRHGRTAANEEHRYAGSSDVPLSEAGKAEARAAGAFADVGRVYVSPLARARQTAAICFPEAEQVVEAGLAEMDFGDFEGRSADEMYGHDRAYTEWVDGGCLAPCPNGESRDEFTQRSASCLARLLRKAAWRGEGRVVVVAHGGTVMAAMDSFAPRRGDDDPRSYYGWHVGNCGGYRAMVSFRDGTPRFADLERFENPASVLTRAAALSRPGKEKG